MRGNGREIAAGYQSMVEFVKLNGTAVRVTGLYRQPIQPDDGPTREEVALVVVLRGDATHRAFRDLLAREPMHLDIPEERSFAAALVSSTWTESGEGDVRAFRHDLTLRELPPSDAVPAATADPIATVEEAALADDEAGEVPLEASQPASMGIDADTAARLGLRLEALIEALTRAGVIELTAIDAAYDRLVADRTDAD